MAFVSGVCFQRHKRWLVSLTVAVCPLEGVVAAQLAEQYTRFFVLTGGGHCFQDCCRSPDKLKKCCEK